MSNAAPSIASASLAPQLFADLDQGDVFTPRVFSEIERAGRGHCSTELDGIHRPTAPVATVEPWPRNEMLAYERELLGFYLTGHPLEAYAGHFDSPKITSISAAQQIEEPSTVRLAGIVCSVEKKFTKKDGKPFAVIVLEDFTGQIELTAWDDVFADKGSLSTWSGDFGGGATDTPRRQRSRHRQCLVAAKAKSLCEACPPSACPRKTHGRGSCPRYWMLLEGFLARGR